MNKKQLKEIEKLTTELEQRYLTARGTGTVDYLSLNLLEAENLINTLKNLNKFSNYAINWTPKFIREYNGTSFETTFSIVIDGSVRNYTVTDLDLIKYSENEIIQVVVDFLANEYRDRIRNALTADLTTSKRNAELINRVR